MIALLLWGCAACSVEEGVTDEVSSCGEDVEVFTSYVWEPVLQQQCVGCHNSDGMASGSAFVLDPDDMLASLQAATDVADRLLLKPSGQHEAGHAGGTLVIEGGSSYDALSFWVDWSQGECALPEDQACVDETLRRRLRRLSHDEYDRTLSDLLGIDSTFGASLAADETVEGFDNDVEALTVSSLLADQYRTAAEDVVSEADLDSLRSCDPQEIGYAACATVFIEEFGLRAFRRPINQTELDRYYALWQAVAVEDGFDEGLRWVVTGMLQSPHFLYRSELGEQQSSGSFEMTDWEIASGLSYLIWGTMPDEVLLSAAEAGELQTQAEISAQVIRMMDDDRALEITADLVEVWLQLDRLFTVSREGLTDELRTSMSEEIRELVKKTAVEGGSLTDLFLSQEAYVDENLADHYGLSGTGWVSLDGAEYGGLLTRGAILTTHGLSGGSGPVQRGVLIRERLLCEPLPPPPSEVDTSPPEYDPDVSTRERYSEHSSNPECASCHNLIDPLGFGFEHYDQLGQWRDDDNGHVIDATGSLDGLDFDGPHDLADALLADTRVHACFDQVWRRWASGTESCGTDRGATLLTDPLRIVAEEEHFTVRTGDVDEGDTFAVGPRLALTDLPEDDADYSGAVILEITENSSWDSGFCADAEVRNEGAETVEWEVRATISGEITSIWNASTWEDGDENVFVGTDWNATLGPSESTTFGFCGSY